MAAASRSAERPPLSATSCTYLDDSQFNWVDDDEMLSLRGLEGEERERTQLLVELLGQLQAMEDM